MKFQCGTVAVVLLHSLAARADIVVYDDGTTFQDASTVSSVDLAATDQLHAGTYSLHVFTEAGGALKLVSPTTFQVERVTFWILSTDLNLADLALQLSASGEPYTSPSRMLTDYGADGAEWHLVDIPVSDLGDHAWDTIAIVNLGSGIPGYWLDDLVLVTPAPDAGVSVDAGAASLDAGVALDGGAADAGAVGDDGGAPPDDGGATSDDGGATSDDGGATSDDGGPPSADDGGPPSGDDAGPPSGDDAGPPSGDDAGLPSSDDAGATADDDAGMADDDDAGPEGGDEPVEGCGGCAGAAPTLPSLIALLAVVRRRRGR